MLLFMPLNDKKPSYIFFKKVKKLNPHFTKLQKAIFYFVS